MKNSLTMHGEIKVTKLGIDKRVIENLYQKNLIVSLGGVYAAARFSTNSNLLNAIAIGTGSTPPATTDNALVAEVLRDSEIYGPTQGVGSEVNQITMTGLLIADSWSGTVNEAGLFSDSTLFSRVVFSTPQTLVTGEALDIEWKISFTGA